MYWQKINSNDEVIGVCRPYNFVRTAKESIIFDITKLCGVFLSINITYRHLALPSYWDLICNLAYNQSLSRH